MEALQTSTAEMPGEPKTWWRRLRDTDTGQTLVEFSLILPLMLIMLFALVDFGRGFYTWLLVTNAAREGARAAATQLDSGQIDARIYDSVCNNYPTSCGIEPGKLVIAKDNVQGDRGEAVDIDLSYEFEFVTPIGDLLAFMGGDNLSAPTITAHSSMRLE